MTLHQWQKILREIGWSERRNSMPLEQVSGPIEKLIEHAVNDPEGHTIYVAVNEENKAIGFIMFTGCRL